MLHGPSSGAAWALHWPGDGCIAQLVEQLTLNQRVASRQFTEVAGLATSITAPRVLCRWKETIWSARLPRRRSQVFLGSAWLCVLDGVSMYKLQALTAKMCQIQTSVQTNEACYWAWLVDGVWYDEWYDTASTGGRFVRRIAHFDGGYAQRRRPRRVSGRPQPLPPLRQSRLSLGAPHADYASA